MALAIIVVLGGVNISVLAPHLLGNTFVVSYRIRLDFVDK